MKASFFALSLLFLFASVSNADRIEYFSYTACYSTVPVREKPNPNARKINEIPMGQKIRVSEQERHWVKIVFRNEAGDYVVGWAASTAMCPNK